LIITIVEHNCVYLSSQNECVFILNSVLISAGYLDIAHYHDGRSQVSIPFHNVSPIWPRLQKGRTTAGWTWWRHRNSNDKICPRQSVLANSVPGSGRMWGNWGTAWA